MSESIQERLRNLEETISRLEYQQDSCRPLLKIARDSQSLVKIEETIANFSKQNSDIDHEYQVNQLALVENNDRLERAKNDSKVLIKSEMIRREQALKDLNEKLGTIEKTFKSIESENASAVKEIDLRLKSEITTLVDSLKKKLKTDRETIQAAVKSSKVEIDKDIKEIKEKQANAEKSIEAFEKRHSGIIVAPGKVKERAKEQGDLRLTLISEITGKITKAVEDCKSQFDQKFRTLNLKFSQELQRIQGQIEEMRKWNGNGSA
jgi:chromosome segregation ATPase